MVATWPCCKNCSATRTWRPPRELHPYRRNRTEDLAPEILAHRQNRPPRPPSRRHPCLKHHTGRACSRTSAACQAPYEATPAVFHSFDEAVSTASSGTKAYPHRILVPGLSY